MAIIKQTVTEDYALYCGDCMEVMSKIENDKIHLSIYSPPFAGLYNYSSNDRDLSNSTDLKQFFEHYKYVIEELYRITMPGRMSCVHCMDIPSSNNGKTDYLLDFPGDIIRMHNEIGFKYIARYHVWKEPLTVRNRTMTKSLAHKMIVDDSSRCSNAGADYLLIFKKKGENKIPITHPEGLLNYAGERPIPKELLRYKGYTGNQIENRYSHWIWRQYASAFWDDVRLDRVLSYKPARDKEDEKHVHPLQLDVIERACILWSNENETVLTPFMGVGSEVYGAVLNNRKALGIELKETYYNQAVKNIESIEKNKETKIMDGLL